jgi:hypothetical protein
MKWISGLLIVALFIPSSIISQTINKDKTTRDVVLSGGFHFGKSIKHTPKFNPDFPGYAIAAEFSMGVNTNGKQYWHHRYRFPEIGGTLFYIDYGNNSVLGRGISLSPYISFPVILSEIYHFHIRLSGGLALISRNYDVINNAENNVIGSRLNSTTQLKLINTLKMSERWALQAALAFTHFSNGNIQKPNLGINSVTGNIGLQYRPNDNPQTYNVDDEKPYFKRFHGMLRTGIAINDGQTTNGSKFVIYCVTGAIAKQTSRFNRVLIGTDYEFRSDRYVALRASIDRQDEISRMDVSRIGVFIGDELLFGNFALSLNMGVYVNKFEGKPFFLYNKNGIVYYVPAQKNKPSLYMGIYLKSHFAIADYFEYGLGYIF